MIFPDDFLQVLVSTVGGVSYDHDKIRIKLRDDLELLDTPVLNDNYGGTGGADGDSSVKGFPKQRAFYYSSFIPPQLCDVQNLIYMVSNDHLDRTTDGDDYSWDAQDSFVAFDGGVIITRGENYGSIRELENVPPASGEVRFLVAPGLPVYMRLGSSPVFDLRVVVPGLQFSSAQETVIYRVTGLLNEIPGLSVETESGPYITGRVVTDSDETYTEFLSDFLKAQHANLWSDSEGSIVCDRFNITSSGTPLTTFTEDDTISMQFEKLINVYKIIVNHGEAFGGSTAGGADVDIKGELAKNSYYNNYTFESASVKSLHKLAKTLVINTKTYLNTIDRNVTVNRYFEQYDDKEIVTVTVSGITSDLLLIDINDVVAVSSPRFGLSGGKNFTVIGVRHDYKQNRMTFKLWG